MKTIYYLSFLLILASCGSEESANVSSEDLTTEETEPNCDCFDADTEVSPEGVAFWEAAWYHYYGINAKEDTANRLIFSGNRVRYLTDNVDNTEILDGVRVYYGLQGTDSIPILLMVGVDIHCNDMNSVISDSSVLVRTPTEEYFCSMEEASEFTDKWKESSDLNNDVLSAVNAYNYELQGIIQLLNSDDNGNSGLFFEFGLRTIAPQEVCFPAPEDGSYGSIIYCNLVYGYHTDSENGEGRMDFAMPCPQMCDSNGSPLAE